MNETMLENGLNFILDAIEQLIEAERDGCENRERKIKYSLLHLSSGIELVLKSRLNIEHWTYIFADMNKANKKALEDGSFRSVDSIQAVERLEKMCGVNIEEKDKKSFKELREFRNQTEHFKINSSIQAIESSINRAINSIVSFISENYCDFESPNIIDFRDDNNDWGLKEEEKLLYHRITESVSQLNNHYSDAIKMAKAKANAEIDIHELICCPSCQENFLKVGDFDDDICHCYFCSYSEHGQKAADDYLTHIEGMYEYEIVKDGERYPLFDCPECGENSFIQVEHEFICFSCGIRENINDVGFCENCGVPYILDAEEDIGLCQNCIDYKWDNMD